MRLLRLESLQAGWLMMLVEACSLGEEYQWLDAGYQVQTPPTH